MAYQYLTVWSSVLSIQLRFDEYFASNPSSYFTLNSIEAYKMIAKSHLGFKSTERRKLTHSLLFWGGFELLPC